MISFFFLICIFYFYYKCSHSNKYPINSWIPALERKSIQCTKMAALSVILYVIATNNVQPAFYC